MPAAPMMAAIPPMTITVGETTHRPITARTPRPSPSSARARNAGSSTGSAQSRATWKIWGNSLGVLDTRADPQNLPDGLTRALARRGLFQYLHGDYGGAYSERAEIYDLVRDAGITGFAIVSGDRHSFWAGYAAKSLPPKAFEPVGLTFITGSISSPGLVEALENTLPAGPSAAPACSWPTGPGGERPQAAVNMLMRHGVRSCLEYARSGDLDAARALSNPDLAPHLEFVDMGGHGYSTVRLSSGEIAHRIRLHPPPVTRAPTGRTAGRCAIASGTAPACGAPASDRVSIGR